MALRTRVDWGAGRLAEMIDHCCRLVGGVEQDRALAGMLALQCSDHRVARADRNELLPVVVEGQDPGYLRERPVRVRAIGRLKLDGHWPVR